MQKITNHNNNFVNFIQIKKPNILLINKAVKENFVQNVQLIIPLAKMVLH